MLHRHTKRLRATLIAVAIIIAIALVANPELRVLLFLIDSLGLDLLALLLATQLRYFVDALLPATAATVGVLCALAFGIGSGAMRTYPNALPWRPFDKLVCPVLVFATYGIRCGIAH